MVTTRPDLGFLLVSAGWWISVSDIILHVGHQDLSHCAWVSFFWISAPLGTLGLGQRTLPILVY